MALKTTEFLKNITSGTKVLEVDQISDLSASLASSFAQKTEMTALNNRVNQIDSKITPTTPSTDASSTALAGAKSTAEFVNSSINNFAAFYLTKNSNGDAFGTYAELTAAVKFYNAGAERTPTKK